MPIFCGRKISDFGFRISDYSDMNFRAQKLNIKLYNFNSIRCSKKSET
jgi:hypothetical protein